MLHYKNLNKLFFESVPQQATDFIALSGFLGPDPIKKLGKLPFKSTIIYGLQKENQKFLLHEQLVNLHNDNRKILYPNIACHSKCYLWLNGNTPIKGLIGSANFSSNGLYNDFRETLLEVDENQLYVLKGYIEIILNSARECNTVVVEEKQETHEDYNKEICEMILYDPRTGQTQPKHGLNWGHSKGNVKPNDACIAIRMEHIRKYPNLFPQLQPNPEKEGETIKEVIEFIWDDGVIMKGRLEGSQPRNGPIKYPKNLTSYVPKNIFGKYIRERMGIPLGQFISREDLLKYGRDTISVSKIEEGVYYLDFSV